ncbi:hypothetical protein [Pseudomonas sp. BMW13]|uniref:hypothetical protein n=1 Tax=Pseudomonas sp. BMW13 TaxID=2562590 RepID=UPI001582E291|nr:hypothetical protein [Pseudomonas sp. BMW13]
MKTTPVPFDQRFIEVPMSEIHMHRTMPRLLICRAFAAQPGRYLFAHWLESMRMDQPADARQADAQRLKGMLAAYMEMDVISADQGAAMAAELTAFAFGAAV